MELSRPKDPIEEQLHEATPPLPPEQLHGAEFRQELEHAFGWTHKWWKLSPQGRIMHYLLTYEKSVNITSPEDLSLLNHLFAMLQTRIFRMRVVVWARTFFYLLLYASVASALAKSVLDLPWIDPLAEPLVRVSLLVGAPIILLYVYLFSRIVNLYLEDIRLYSLHIMTILTKYESSLNFKDFIEKID